jgi:thymidylate synthase
MERLWPKYARSPARAANSIPRRGIAWEYGDLGDLVKMLATEPGTRQAWIPLFFPEDTGVGDGGRKPCTLGYQVIVRDGRAHIWYPLRSCDLIRHFRDDCYLAIRLLLWIIEQCREISPAWEVVQPGSYAMHMTSLHVFENDRRNL